MPETWGTQHPFGPRPSNQSAPAPKGKGKFWRKIRSFFSWRPTKSSPTPQTDSSTRVQSVVHLPSTSTMAPAYRTAQIESRSHYGAAPGSPHQMSHVTPLHSNLPIAASPVHNGPDIHYTRTYSAFSPLPEGNGFINENYSLSYHQSNRRHRTTFRNNTVAISGTDNVIRLNDQEFRT